MPDLDMDGVAAPSRTVSTERRRAMPLDEVLFHCLAHFVHLDHANAAIHCAPVRYSPITFRLAEALLDLDVEAAKDPDVLAVLAHVGQYEEDKGR